MKKAIRLVLIVGSKIKNAMIIHKIDLVALLLVRYLPIQLVFNPVECVTVAASIRLSVLVVCRELAAVPKVKTQIKTLGSMKKFLEKFQNNKYFMEACREFAYPTINQEEEELCRCCYSGNRIKIVRQATEEEIQFSINFLRRNLYWISEDRMG